MHKPTGQLDTTVEQELPDRLEGDEWKDGAVEDES